MGRDMRETTTVRVGAAGAEAVRQWIGYDWMKLAVAAILALLLLWLSLAGQSAPVATTPAAATSAPAVLTVPVETVTTPGAVATAVNAPTLLAPAAGSQLPPGSITVSGKAAPGAEVQVSVDGTPVGTARAGSDGTWSLSTSIATPGAHSIVAQTLDSAGAVASASEPLALTVAAPGAAPVVQLAAGAPVTAGELTIRGTGTPGTELEIVVGGNVVGKVTVGADGAWALPTRLEPGTYEVVARALDANGAVTASSSPVQVAVQSAGPALAITDPADGASLAAGNVAISGTGTPGSTIEILDGDTVIGTANVGADGTWTFTPDPALAAGARVLSVRAQGSTSAGSPVRVTVGAAAAAATAGPAATAAPAGGAPAISGPTDGAQLPVGPITLNGTGTPGTEIEILDSDKVLGKAQVGADGTWTFSYTPEPGSTPVYSVRPAGSTTVATQSVRVSIGTPAAQTCTALAVNCTAWVTREGGLSLRIRDGAGTSASIITLLPIGAEMTLLEGPQAVDGFNWWRVRTVGGREGWVAGENLRLKPD